MNTLNHIHGELQGGPIKKASLLFLTVMLIGCQGIPIRQNGGHSLPGSSLEDIREGTMLATMMSAKLAGLDKKDIPKVLSTLRKVEEGLWVHQYGASVDRHSSF